MKPSDALATHRDALLQLLQRAGFTHALVYGSVLAGTDTEASDLDLLVDPTDTTTLLTLACVEAKATDLLGVRVSVLTPGFLPDSFRDRVLRAARPL
jgi:predicted nucleotidyltransferase